MIRPLPKPFALLPRHVRNGVRSYRDCDGRGWHDNGAGHKLHGTCLTCNGDGAMRQVVRDEPLKQLARWRPYHRAGIRFYAHARRVAFQPVRLPGGAA